MLNLLPRDTVRLPVPSWVILQRSVLPLTGLVGLDNVVLPVSVMSNMSPAPASVFIVEEYDELTTVVEPPSTEVPLLSRMSPSIGNVNLPSAPKVQ
jgi:hypothetical protein